MSNKRSFNRSERRLPAAIRTVSDVELLMRSAAAVRHLPRGGIPVAIAGIDPQARSQFQARLQEYTAACGCGAGAAACLASLVLLGGCIWLAAPHANWSQLGLIAAAGMAGTLVITGIAKVIALRVARARFESSCARLIRSLPIS